MYEVRIFLQLNQTFTDFTYLALGLSDILTGYSLYTPMDISKAPFKTARDWGQFAKRLEIDSTALYDLKKLKSGSKIEKEH